MKKKQIKKGKDILSFSTLLCLLFILFTGNGCNPNTSGNSNNSSLHLTYANTIPYDTTYPLIIWKNPNVSQKEFIDALKKFESTIGPITDSVSCSDCDNQLQKLSGKGPLNFIQGQTAPGGSVSGGGSKKGGNGEYPFYYSANFIIKIPGLEVKKEDTPIVSAPKQKAYKDTAVTIAVFDTGLDPDLLNNDKSYRAEISSVCIPHSNHGWNFVKNTPDTREDNKYQRHGTIVSDFIFEQSNEFLQNRARLLPVKTHDSVGRGDLYNVLCGFAYAAKSGAKVINASFGYYGYGDDSCTLLFKEYIKYYLTGNNILLICAAGNVDTAADAAIKNIKGSGINPRNLEINPFYPACFSKDLPNVITVTTISELHSKVSDDQNYSSKYVDIGVNCDSALNPSIFLFINPLQRGSLIDGSSYATPVVAGKICANYTALTKSGTNKDKIIALMMNPPALAFPVSLLNPTIKNGTVVKR